MNKFINDTTHDKGENLADEQTKDVLENQEQKNNIQDESQAKTVPYERFKQVNEEKKQAQAELESLCNELIEEIPEEFRSLVPSELPAIKRIQWLQNAKKAGLFNTTQEVLQNSPHSERPLPKKEVDLNTLNPMQMIQQGYK